MILTKIIEWNMSVPHDVSLYRNNSIFEPSTPTFKMNLILTAAVNLSEVDRIVRQGHCIIVDDKEYDEFLHWKTNKAIMEP